jgi:ATP-dependent RNA helicase DOB1
VITEYYDLKEKIGVYEQDMKDVMNHPNYCLPFIQPGRLVRIKHGNNLFDWGVIINYNKRIKPFVRLSWNWSNNQNQEVDLTPQESFIVDVAMWLDASSAPLKGEPRIKEKDLLAISPGPPGVNAKEGRMEIVPGTLATIDSISTIRIPLPKDLKSIDHRLDLRKTIEEVKRRFPDGIPNLDPIKNMSIADESFKNLVKVVFLKCSLTLENRSDGITIDCKSIIPFP